MDLAFVEVYTISDPDSLSQIQRTRGTKSKNGGKFKDFMVDMFLYF